MKICPQCSRTYADDTVFCLSDGTPLIWETPEEQTVLRSIPPVAQTAAERSGKASKKSSTAIIVVIAIGLLFALGVIGLAAVLIFSRMNSEGVNNSAANTAVNKANNSLANSKGQISNSAANEDLSTLEAERKKLQQEKDKLEKDKLALAKEKDKLKDGSDDFQHEDYVDPKYEHPESAKVIDPPTNIRVTPNGKVLCDP